MSEDFLSRGLTSPPPQRRHGQILEGAALVFAREGYEGASMAQIAAQAKVSKGTLYNYFPSKEALFNDFVRDQCAQLANELFGAPTREVRMEAVLLRIGGTMLRGMVSDRGLAVFRLAVMEASKFPHLARVFMEAGPNNLVARMAAWLESQATLGLLAMDDPIFAAEQFFALTQAKLVLRTRVNPAERPTEPEIEAVVAGAVRVFLAAYGTQPEPSTT